jgi:hypothetical protein
VAVAAQGDCLLDLVVLLLELNFGLLLVLAALKLSMEMLLF